MRYRREIILKHDYYYDYYYQKPWPRKKKYF